jgi:pyruvyl transferase EpsO
MNAGITANTALGVIQRTQAQIDDVVSDLARGHTSYALCDFPDHNNVGDSAIYLGELAYFRNGLKRYPSYICRADQCDYERLGSEYADSLIFIHGGGNFGDIWPWHHDYRLALLERFRGRRIVQLPQSLKFNSPEGLARTAEAIKRHGNFVLLVRDDRSFELARSHFDCTVIRSPDMAFWMGPLRRIGEPKHDLLFLLRDDAERAPTLGTLPGIGRHDVLVDDWHMDTKALRAVRKLVALGSAAAESPRSIAERDAFRALYFERLAEKRVERGLTLLSSGRHIITDRLHAYILALLLDIPRFVIDNSYGKLSGYINTWMDGDDRVPTYASLGEAFLAWSASQTVS